MTVADRDQKLVISVVQRQDAEKLLKALAQEGFGSTVLTSTGSFLRKGNATIISLCPAGAVEQVLQVIRDTASERSEVRDPGISLRATEWYVPTSFKVQTGGASVWVIDAELAGSIRVSRPAKSGPRED